MKLYTFLLIINGLTLKNFTLPKNRDILFLYRCTVLLLAFCLNHGFKGFHRLHGKLYIVGKNEIVHIFIDNQRVNTKKLYTPEESGHSVSIQVYSFVVGILSESRI